MGMDVACCLGVRVKEKLATPIATPPHKSLLNKHKETTHSPPICYYFIFRIKNIGFRICFKSVFIFSGQLALLKGQFCEYRNSPFAKGMSCTMSREQNELEIPGNKLKSKKETDLKGQQKKTTITHHSFLWPWLSRSRFYTPVSCRPWDKIRRLCWVVCYTWYRRSIPDGIRSPELVLPPESVGYLCHNLHILYQTVWN